MDNAQFDEWLDYHLNAFPDMRRWLGSIENPSETLALWQSALHDCELRHAKQATSAMIAGDVDAPAAYERERLPAIIRKHIKQLRTAESQQAKASAAINTALIRGRQMPLRPYVERARSLGRELRNGELSFDEYQKQLAGVLTEASSDPKASDPIFTCNECCDQGVIHVWHPNEIQKAKRGLQPKRIGAALSCRCKFALKSNDTYDESRHFKLRYGTPTAQEQEQLKDWIDSNRIGRHKGFDDWNEQSEPYWAR